MESGMQEIFLLESGIPVSLTKNFESSTWNPQSTASNPEFKTITDFLAWGDKGINLCCMKTFEFMLLHVCRKVFPFQDDIN